MSAREKVHHRRLDILKMLDGNEKGRAGCEGLARVLGVSTRTVQLDCREMVREELVRTYRGGVEITPRGQNLCRSGALAPADSGRLCSPLKDVDLRRAAIVRLLCQAGMNGVEPCGLALKELQQRLESTVTGAGELPAGGPGEQKMRRYQKSSADTLERDLQIMREAGLVFQEENGNWRLGRGLLPPLKLGAPMTAALMEQLQIAPGLIPMSDEIRVDRIEDVRLLDDYCPAPAFYLNDYLTKCWGVNKGPRLPVVYRCSNTHRAPLAVERLRRELAAREGVSCTISGPPDGPVEVQDEVEGFSEFLAWLRRYGDAVTVLSPKEVKDSLYRTGLKMLQRYGEVK